MSTPTKTTINPIILGEPVSPTVANRPHGDIEDSLDDIFAYIGGGHDSFFDNDTGTTTGLTFGYLGGTVKLKKTLVVVSDSTIALTANSTNYVELNTAGAVVNNVSSWTAGYIPLWEIVTDGAAITSQTSRRTWAIVTDATQLGLNNGNFTSDNVDGALDEIDARLDAIADDSIAYAIVFGS